MGGEIELYKYMWIVYFCKSFCKQILGNSYLCCMCDLYLKNTFQAPHSGIAVVVLDRHCILTKCNDTKKKQCMDFFTRLGEICLGYRLWEKKHLSLYLNSNHVSNQHQIQSQKCFFSNLSCLFVNKAVCWKGVCIFQSNLLIKLCAFSCNVDLYTMHLPGRKFKSLLLNIEAFCFILQNLVVLNLKDKKTRMNPAIVPEELQVCNVASLINKGCVQNTIKLTLWSPISN